MLAENRVCSVEGEKLGEFGGISMRRMAAVIAGVAALGFGLVPVASRAASAPARSVTSLPVIYSGMGGTWANASVRPRLFVLGALYYMESMSWSRWTDSGALGHGKQIACAGAAGPCDNYRVTITLTHVARHDGRRYYATMKIAGKRHKTYWLVMRDGWWHHTQTHPGRAGTGLPGRAAVHRTKPSGACSQN